MVLIKVIAIHSHSLSSPFQKSMPFLIFQSGSFAVPIGDHFQSGIICGPIWGSFAVRDHLRSWDHLQTRTLPLNLAIITRFQCGAITKTASDFNFFKSCCYQMHWSRKQTILPYLCSFKQAIICVAGIPVKELTFVAFSLRESEGKNIGKRPRTRSYHYELRHFLYLA